MRPNDGTVCPIFRTEGAYANHGCRCEWCTRRHREYMRNYRRSTTGRGRLNTQVHARAASKAVSEFRAEHPERWREILNAEWVKSGGRSNSPQERAVKP
jgi:hypothetical protein